MMIGIPLLATEDQPPIPHLSLSPQTGLFLQMGTRFLLGRELENRDKVSLAQ